MVALCTYPAQRVTCVIVFTCMRSCFPLRTMVCSCVSDWSCQGKNSRLTCEISNAVERMYHSSSILLPSAPC